MSDCRGIHVPEKQLTWVLHNQKNNLKSTHNCKDLDIIQNGGHWKGNSKHGYLFEYIKLLFNWFITKNNNKKLHGLLDISNDFLKSIYNFVLMNYKVYRFISSPHLLTSLTPPYFFSSLSIPFSFSSSSLPFFGTGYQSQDLAQPWEDLRLWVPSLAPLSLILLFCNRVWSLDKI